MINYFNFAPQKHDSAALLKQNYTIDMFRYLILINDQLKIVAFARMKQKTYCFYGGDRPKTLRTEIRKQA